MMQLHTRVKIIGRMTSGSYRTIDFGIPYQPDRGLARQDPKVVAEVERLQKIYPLVSVDFSDSN